MTGEDDEVDGGIQITGNRGVQRCSGVNVGLGRESTGCRGRAMHTHVAQRPEIELTLCSDRNATATIARRHERVLAAVDDALGGLASDLDDVGQRSAVDARGLNAGSRESVRSDAATTWRASASKRN